MIRGFVTAVVAAGAIGLVPAADAQQALNFSKRDANAPIQVSADSFQADLNAKTGTYVGNVIVTQGDMRMHADRVRVNVTDNKPDKVVATGHVVVDAPSGTATGDNGDYEVQKRTIVLTGRVVLTKAKNVMRGSVLTVNLATGMANLGTGGTRGGRVQGLFAPPPQKQ